MAQLFNDVTGNETEGDWVNMTKSVDRVWLTVQVTSEDPESIVVVQGRVNNNHAAQTISTLIGSDADTYAYFPQMRVIVTTTAQLNCDAIGQ